MLKYQVGLPLVMIVCLSACVPATHTSTSGGPASTPRGTTSTSTARPLATSSHRIGFETSKGWCGPDVPLPRTAMVIDVEPDGIHPLCASLGPAQHLVIANLTTMDGYVGSQVTVVLPGQPRRVVSPGSQLTLPGVGDHVLHQARTKLVLTSDLPGLGDAGTTLWRVNSQGIAY